jgi:hypothetical protein
MKQLLVIIGLGFSLCSSAQSYHPFIKTNATWDILNFDSQSITGFTDGGYRGYFTTETDSFNGHLYTKYYLHHIASSDPQVYWPGVVVSIPFLSGYMREDTLNRKVYKYNSFTNSEELLYDFSLADGDTIFVNCMETSTTVDTASSLLNDGSVRRSYWIYNTFTIEGIGRSFDRDCPLWIGNGYTIGCYKENGVSLWGTHCSISSIEEQKTHSFTHYSNNGVRIYNPQKRSQTLSIFDVTGKKVAEHFLHNSHLLENQEFSKGLYFYRLADGSGGKFVIP